MGRLHPRRSISRSAKGCNSGVFIRTFPLTPRPGKDVGFNGIEVAIDDTTTAGFHDTGAIYDLVQAAQERHEARGQWNHMQITCDKNLISVELNGDAGDEDGPRPMDRRRTSVPTASEHKFDVAYKDHPRRGYIGLQDHGGECWYKNIKLKPLVPA